MIDCFLGVNVWVCSDYNNKNNEDFAKKLTTFSHVNAHSTMAWFAVMWLMYTIVFWKLENYVKEQKRMQRREIAPPTQFVVLFVPFIEYVTPHPPLPSPPPPSIQSSVCFDRLELSHLCYDYFDHVWFRRSISIV